MLCTAQRPSGSEAAAATVMHSAAEKTCSHSLRNLLIRTKLQVTGPALSYEAAQGYLSWEDIVDVVKRYLWYPNLAGKGG